MYNLLVDVDERCAETMHANNIGRVVRGLEAFKLTGMTMEEREAFSRSKPSPYNVVQIGIAFNDRAALYDRINRRVDMMMQAGLLEEIRGLQGMEFSQTATQAIGYKEFKPYFAGECDLQPCVELIKQQSRRYAKRQLTWFRHQTDVDWIVYDDFNSLESITTEALTRIRRSVL